ncbi:Cytochrome P450 [Amanita muscaria]
MATPVFIDVLVGFLCFMIYFLLLKWSRKDYLPLPPGPHGFPLVGNLLDVLRSSKWLKLHELSKEFGGRDVVILDSWEAAWDLLEKRSSIYSDRPRMRLLNELVGLDYIFALRNLEILSETCDKVQPNDDPYIELAEQCTRYINEAAIPGAYLVDAFPILQYVPEWMRQAMIDRPFRAAKTSIDSGTSMPSFVNHCYNNTNEDDRLTWQEYLIQETVATLYMAGADTRAQREIDSAIPYGELPTF